MCWQDGGEVPGQEFVDTVNRVIGDAFEHVAQIEFRVETITNNSWMLLIPHL